MKKLILFTVLAAIFASCEGPRGFNGLDGKDGLFSQRIVELSVTAADWQPMPSSSNVRYYSAYFNNVSEITENIFYDGIVLCYLYENNRQIILPSVRHNESVGNLWTNTIDFEYFIGGLEIFFTNSDLYYPAPPQDMIFVLQILY
ncbi:MAG: hypothetical protein LBB53_01930 [Prevotellaceae bacterium]|jgi:hypothetical protein|nr:hypothetical protein [Prevotellaceae bacterium]